MAELILFDGECALCNRSVRFLIRRDRRRRFLFAPLQGTSAAAILKSPIPLDSLILVEGFRSDKQRLFRYGKGALRICWHLGGLYRLLGFLSFLPRWLVDPPYRWIARNRHTLFRGDAGELELEQERLLP